MRLVGEAGGLPRMGRQGCAVVAWPALSGMRPAGGPGGQVAGGASGATFFRAFLKIAAGASGATFSRACLKIVCAGASGATPPLARPKYCVCVCRTNTH